MCPDRLLKVRGPPVMQEEETLPQTPQGCGAKLIRPCISLPNAIRKSRAHVMQSKIRIGMVGHVGQGSVTSLTSGKRRCVTERTTNCTEEASAVLGGWRGRRRFRSRKEAHENGETDEVRRNLSCAP